MAEGWHPTRGTDTSVAGYVTPTFHERLCVYVHPPFTHEVRPRAGRWIGVSAWPPTDGSAGPIKCATFRLSAGDNGLVRCTRDSHDDAVWGVWGAEGDHAASAVDGVSVRSEWATRVISTDTCMAGGHGGEWLSYGGPDLAGDQRMDDAQCLTWDSPPLDADYAVRSTGSRRVVVCGRCDQSPCRVCSMMHPVHSRSWDSLCSAALSALRNPSHSSPCACARCSQTGHRLKSHAAC